MNEGGVANLHPSRRADLSDRGLGCPYHSEAALKEPASLPGLASGLSQNITRPYSCGSRSQRSRPS